MIKPKVIHIVEHKPTGARIPMLINEVKNMGDKQMITNYQEHLEQRRGFTLEMLVSTWDTSKDEVLQLLKKFQIPGHINHSSMKGHEDKSPSDFAIFFEEYIYGVERVCELQHTKLKSKLLKDLS